MEITVKNHTLQQLITALGDDRIVGDISVFTRNPPYPETKINYPFRSDHYSVLLLTKGYLTLKLNLVSYTVKPNGLLLIAPNDIRQFETISADCSFMGLVFTSDFLSNNRISNRNIEAFEFFSSNAERLINTNADDVSIIRQFLAILSTVSINQGNAPFYTEVLTHTFSALIFEVANQYKKSYPNTGIKHGRKEDLTLQFLKVLPNYFKEERSVRFYADQLFVTPKYLTQTVKDVTGKTAGEFIDEMVIVEAKVLLNEPALSIGQVADALHFSDQFFFSKYFKKHYGKNPSEYRAGL